MRAKNRGVLLTLGDRSNSFKRNSHVFSTNIQFNAFVLPVLVLVTAKSVPNEELKSHILNSVAIVVNVYF